MLQVPVMESCARVCRCLGDGQGAAQGRGLPVMLQVPVMEKGKFTAVGKFVNVDEFEKPPQELSRNGTHST